MSNTNSSWKKRQLSEIANKRAENVDPTETNLERHIGLEHITSNNPNPDFERPENLSSTKRKFKAGDILFAKLRPNLEKAAQPSFEGVCSTDIFPVVAKNEVNSKFLFYQLSSKKAFDWARRTSAGTRMPRTSWDLFSNLEIGIPPREEQRKIACILYNVDRAIEKTEEIIEQTKRVKQGVMQDLFTEGYYDHASAETRLGAKLKTVPRDWDIKQLGDLADYQNGYGFSKDDWADEGKLIIRIQDLTSPEDSDKNYYQGDIDPKYKVEKGDILVSWSATLGVFRWTREDAVLNQHIFKVRNVSDNVDQQFLYHLLSNAVAKLKQKIQGSTMKHITRSAFENTEVVLPDVAEQKKISNVLEDYNEKIKNEKAKLKTLQSLKKGLVQDLFTGKIRTEGTNIPVIDEVKG